jgi:hypothetical protein
VRLVDASGDVSFNRSLALLQKTNYTQMTQSDALSSYSRRASTLWGLAFRPIGNDELNALAKVEYVNALNPLTAGVLTSRGEEARTIAALETVWSPEPIRVATRYAPTHVGIIPQLDGSVTRSFHRGLHRQPHRRRHHVVARGARRDASPRRARERDARWDWRPGSHSTRGPKPPTVPHRATSATQRERRPGWFLTFGAKLTERSAKNVASGRNTGR